MKNKYIKSTYLSVPIETDIKGILYITKKNDIVYTTLNISKEESISLGGDIIKKTDTDLSLRIKLEDISGNERLYPLYNKTLKTVEQVPVSKVIAILETHGFKVKEFNNKDIIPSI